MTRLMYDALQASGIPLGAEVACWYPYDSRSDGAPRSARQILTIDNTADGAHPDCNILDVEPGACWDAGAVNHWLDQKAASDDPGTLYYSENNRATVTGWVPREHQWWAADWTGVQEDIIAGSVAMQFRNAGAYDLSLVVDDSWHPAPSSGQLPAWPAPGDIHDTMYPPRIEPGFADVAWGSPAGPGHQYHVQLLRGDVSMDDRFVIGGHYEAENLQPGVTYTLRVAVDADAAHQSSPWASYDIVVPGLPQL